MTFQRNLFANENGNTFERKLIVREKDAKGFETDESSKEIHPALLFPRIPPLKRLRNCLACSLVCVIFKPLIFFTCFVFKLLVYG